MARVLVVTALAMIGCGRLAFEPLVAGDASPVLGDAPPVPTSICGVYRFPLRTVPPLADLAIAPVTEGYAALWVDASAASAAHGAVISPEHQLARTTDLPALTDTALGGLADAGQVLVLAGSNGTDETLWTVGRDLGTATPQTTLSNHVMAHDPFPSGVGPADRTFVTGSNDKLEISLVASDGTISAVGASQPALGRAISDLACANGPARAHCAWIEAPVPLTCFVAEVNGMGPPAMIVGTPQIISINCRQIRTASGPAAANSALTVWRDARGGISARYRDSSGQIDISVPIADQGSAPKVQFDGTRFWVASLDRGGDLQLTSYELDGTLVSYALAGWRPVGPEAFQLVNRGAETALVLLSAGELDFLTICP